MRELKKREAPPVVIATATEKVDSAVAAAPVTGETAQQTDTGSPMQTDQDQLEDKSSAGMQLTGLLKEQKILLINDAVGLIHQKLDPDTLQASMRLLLRFTRDYELAQHFAEMRGPQILLSLDRRSFFDSFSSFLTHLIRHIVENGALLEYSMEKVMRVLRRLVCETQCCFLFFCPPSFF